MSTFVPLGVAQTEAEGPWPAAERQRLRLSENDELIAFAWGTVQEP